MEKVIKKKKGNQLYGSAKVMIIRLITSWNKKKSLCKMSHFPEPISCN